MALNVAILQGRLTKDPEKRFTSNNIPVTSFSIAVDRSFGKDDNGKPLVDFINCTAWRQTAEFISKYFTKGDMIALRGRIQTRTYTDRDNNKRTAFEVVADEVPFCGRKSVKEETETATFKPVDIEPEELPF